jgi:ribosome assembly protein 1
MSDGAIVLVDVNEGVSPQTHTVIKQAWAEKVKLCLVLNKIDRLIVERRMDGTQIYTTLV